jgi:hypothetical protein
MTIARMTKPITGGTSDNMIFGPIRMELNMFDPRKHWFRRPPEIAHSGQVGCFSDLNI